MCAGGLLWWGRSLLCRRRGLLWQGRSLLCLSSLVFGLDVLTVKSTDEPKKNKKNCRRYKDVWTWNPGWNVISLTLMMLIVSSHLGPLPCLSSRAKWLSLSEGKRYSAWDVLERFGSSCPAVARLDGWAYRGWGWGSPRSPNHTVITPQVAVLEAIHGGPWISSHKHHSFQAELASRAGKRPVFREALCLWFMDSFTAQPEIPRHAEAVIFQAPRWRSVSLTQTFHYFKCVSFTGVFHSCNNAALCPAALTYVKRLSEGEIVQTKHRY